MAERINLAVWLEKHERWQIKVQKDNIRKTFTCPTPGRKGQIECQRKADAWLDSGVDPSIRVSKIYADFLEDIKARTSTGNYTNLESLGRVWILPKIGTKRMSSVTEQDFQDIINYAYTSQKRSKKTLSNIRGCVTAFLRYARKSKATTLHATDLVLPREAEIGEKQVLSPDELATLFNVVTTEFRGKTVDEFYIHAFRFLVAVGLRPGELCEMKSGAFKDSEINVTGSYNRFGEHTKGKTQNAIRSFVLPQVALNILAEQKTMLKDSGIISPYLFPSRDGAQLEIGELYKRWRRYQEVNGITKISLYELRHTFVSICKGNIPEKLLQPVVGHSPKMSTYKTYGHEMDGELERVAGMIDTAYNDILKMG